MLVNGRDLLAVAHDNDFAVPAFNISDHAMLNGIVEISEELQAPLIVAIHPDELRHTGVDMMESVIARAHRATVPVAVHFDHGATFEQILLAIRTGFTSVMIDGSTLPFAENVAITQRVVEAAHTLGISVEGELGTIGKTDSEAEDGTDAIIYTVPDDAVTFVAETGVDSLAIAIGTSHGIYPAHMKPELKLDLLQDIAAKVDVPLVLHGGSGNPDDEIARSVKLGINKINISSDIKVAYHLKLREVLADTSLREPNTIQPPAVDAMKLTAAQKIELFDAAGKAALY
ncbi:ketose-bisphosphate aldolase [Jiangella alkaliphila]|uniref:Fructose-bisphosphate aldolase, class II n=1 Tax=Jiangella alkaliphila TaxID=419479 RepID=A0A1H2JCG5_9ACTN|nr:ketose-bisphosphate aldolase [Jiangella alkaliphila]SDU53788.1 fructose-bisphosphate aldolase, class II [Jiangella alkaliphila]